jgi:hypothetical protein
MKDSLVDVKIKQVVSECELHQKRIQHALEKLKNFMPFEPFGAIRHYPG